MRPYYHGRVKNSQQEIGYPRARLEALYDGIFAVAMTLLVLDIRLPDDFHPKDAAELLRGLIGLWARIMPYLLSFLVLGMRWLAGVQVRIRAEHLGGSYVRWWIFYLLLITCVPFTTNVVGRYASFAPAIWLYAGNTALIAIASWNLLRLAPDVENRGHRRGRQASSGVLFASALLCIGWSFFDPSWSLWAFLLNLATPLIVRWNVAQESTAQP